MDAADGMDGMDGMDRGIIDEGDPDEITPCGIVKDISHGVNISHGVKMFIG